MRIKFREYKYEERETGSFKKPRFNRTPIVALVLLLLIILAIVAYQTNLKPKPPRPTGPSLSEQLPRIPYANVDYLNIMTDKDIDGVNDQLDILEGAKLEVKKGIKNILVMDDKTLYFPGGDPPDDRGVATDLVIRALRNAGYDLKELINADIANNPDGYPLWRWEQKVGDPNIDYRRAENMVVYFKRFGKELTTIVDENDELNVKEWAPGDIVFWEFTGDEFADHCGILSDRLNNENYPLVIHNFYDPGYAAEQDVLEKWTILAHFRFPK